MYAIRINFDIIAIKTNEMEARKIAASHAKCTEEIEIASFVKGLGWIPLQELSQHGSHATA